MKRTAGFKLAVAVVIAVILTGLSWAGLEAGVFSGTQLRLTDGLFPSAPRDPGIVVVGIDQKSLTAIGRWPWDRAEHARIIDRLREAGARRIGYDVTFSEPSSSDGALAASIAKTDGVVLGAVSEFAGKIGRIPRAVAVEQPVPSLGRVADAPGHVNITPDTDGIARTVPPVVEAPNGDLLPSLSFALFALDELGSAPVTLRTDAIAVGDRFVPTGPGHLMDVNFTTDIPIVSAIDVIEGKAVPAQFRDKTVLVGVTAIDLGDHKLTPLNKAGGQPGVLFHANALNTMTTRSFLHPDSRAVVLAVIFVLALLLSLGVLFLRIWLSTILGIGLLVAFFLLSFQRFDGGRVTNLVYPPAGAIIAFVAGLGVRYFTEVRERRRVTQVFGRYLAKDVVDEVLTAPETAMATVTGASRELSILFSDLRGFTSASEGMPPEEVVKALNLYLDAMTRAVIEERGTIDKFMGDCVMAFWNAPREDPQHPVRAVRAAQRMLELIDEVMTTPEAENFKVKGCGVGVATGQAVVGNIGSSERLDYTVVGDTVNTASRLCGAAGAGKIVVTEECALRIEDEFSFVPLEPLSVKGKAEPLRVFEVIRKGIREPAAVGGRETLAGDPTKTGPQAKAAGYAPVEPKDEPKRG